MNVSSLLFQVAHLNWRGEAVLILLLLLMLFCQIFKKIPRDLVFTIGALLSPLLGIVNSTQIFKAGLNQATLMILGLWGFAKAMQVQGLFHAIVPLFTLEDKQIWRRLLFFLQVAVCGAFLSHRYFPLTVLSSLSQRIEHEKKSLNPLGFPFAYLLLIGGWATIIGTPTSILLLSLYSTSVSKISFPFFAVLPLAILPLLFSLFFLLWRGFHRPFSQFLEASVCAVIFPDSPVIGKVSPYPILRRGEAISNFTTSQLERGDLILPVTNSLSIPFEKGLFAPLLEPSAVWKKKAVLLIFLSSIFSTFIGLSVGAAFFLGGVCLVLIRAFPMKKSFRKEFPLPLLLEIFSAYLFFFALQSSELDRWIASFIPWRSPFVLVSLFFFCAQCLAHLMTRPLAFASLFSVVLVLFSGQPTQIFFISVIIAFAAAIPLFGNPLIDEMAISVAISGNSSLRIRLLLLTLLFVSLMLPVCIFWPV